MVRVIWALFEPTYLLPDIWAISGLIYLLPVIWTLLELIYLLPVIWAFFDPTYRFGKNDRGIEVIHSKSEYACLFFYLLALLVLLGGTVCPTGHASKILEIRSGHRLG